jgi:hypothetical protein
LAGLRARDAAFFAQYQQRPIPAEGNLNKAEWLYSYEVLPEKQSLDRIVQAWDCAAKSGELNDFSVCITFLVHENVAYVIDVLRQKLIYPELKQQVLAEPSDRLRKKLCRKGSCSGRVLVVRGWIKHQAKGGGERFGIIERENRHQRSGSVTGRSAMPTASIPRYLRPTTRRSQLDLFVTAQSAKAEKNLQPKPMASLRRAPFPFR